ncbi:MAG: amidohydrolase family protein, partial [Bryobacteraceae bacterium]
RNAGFTTAIVFPTQGIFAGQGSAIDLAGTKVGGMILLASAGQYISMASSGPGFPNSLMGAIAYIRQLYLDAAHYRLIKAAYDAHPRGMKRPDYDRALEGVIESKRILLPADSRVEIDRMLHLARDLGQSAILYGVQEGYRAADLLSKSGVPVLVDLDWPEKPAEADPDDVELLRTLELREKAPSTPLALMRAGVKFAFYSDGLEPHEIGGAIQKTIQAGLPREAAIHALTLSPAEIYGIADRVGSIETGKIANLLVTHGDLFEDGTRIETIFVDGVQYTPERGK